MFGKLLLDDFILECDVRAPAVPTGGRFGFLFRAADVKNGAIDSYYALLLDPRENTVALMCWENGAWRVNVQQPAPPRSLTGGIAMRIGLEAVGARFRIFIDDRFAAEFRDARLSAGRLGLCIAPVSSAPCTVYFDKFKVFLTPKG
jgi:hypothetical protein